MSEHTAYAEERRFYDTVIGGRLRVFENALGRAWQTDSRESASDASMRRDWAAADEARTALIDAIKELQASTPVRAPEGNHDEIRG